MTSHKCAPETMKRLLEQIETDHGLTETKRRDLACSIRKFVEYLGLDLHMPADFPTYRGHIQRFDPARAGVTTKRWANIRSDVAFALKRFGARTRAPLPMDLTPEWQACRALLTDVVLVRGLSRLAHWCSRTGIAPGSVNDEVMAAFQAHLDNETFEKRPDRAYQRTCKLWNQAAAEVAGWPSRQVTLPSFRKLISLPLAEFPASFREDLDRYARRVSAVDLTANDLPETPLRPSTIEQHLKQLRRFASVMVRTGRPVAEIIDLAVLIEIEPFKRTMQAEFERLGGAKPSLFELAATLVGVARHDVHVPEWHLHELSQVKRRLKCRPRGFTDKNRERLRPFSDEMVQARFFNLGDKLLQLATKRDGDRKAALLVQTALAHEILLEAPMRFGNLTRLNLFEHFEQIPPGRKVRARIDVPGHEVKNGEPLTFLLSPQTTTLLLSYRRKYRPLLLSGPDEGWLFPGQDGSHKHQVSLSAQLCKAVKRHVGVTVNPHLYRHLAAYFFLSAHPSEFETVRRLLGHKSIETTTAFYTDFDRLFAIRRYGEHILERRLRLAG